MPAVCLHNSRPTSASRMMEMQDFTGCSLNSEITHIYIPIIVNIFTLSQLFTVSNLYKSLVHECLVKIHLYNEFELSFYSILLFITEEITYSIWLSIRYVPYLKLAMSWLLTKNQVWTQLKSYKVKHTMLICGNTIHFVYQDSWYMYTSWQHDYQGIRGVLWHATLWLIHAMTYELNSYYNHILTNHTCCILQPIDTSTYIIVSLHMWSWPLHTIAQSTLRQNL